MIFVFFTLFSNKRTHSRSSSNHQNIIFMFLLVINSSCRPLLLFIHGSWYLQIRSISNTRSRYYFVFSFHATCSFLTFVALGLIILMDFGSFKLVVGQVIPRSFHASCGWACTLLERNFILRCFLWLWGVSHLLIE